jgi:hypothetical protein
MQVNGVSVVVAVPMHLPSIDAMLMLFSGLFRVGALPDVDESFSEMKGFHNIARLYIVVLLHGYCPQYQCLPARRKPLKLKRPVIYSHLSQLSSSVLTTAPAPTETPKRSRRARRAPTAPDKTSPKPATPPPPKRKRRQPAPPTEPELAPAPAEGPPVEPDPVGKNDGA